MNDKEFDKLIYDSVVSAASKDAYMPDMNEKIKAIANSALVQSSNINLRKIEMEKTKTQKVPHGKWMRFAAAAMALVLVCGAVVGGYFLFGGGDALQIKDLAEYKAVADNYLALSEETNLDIILSKLNNFNFKVVSNGSLTTYLTNAEEEEVVVDGKKAKITLSLGEIYSGEKIDNLGEINYLGEIINYIDGNRRYFQQDDNWYYDADESYLLVAETIISVFNEVLDPDLYDKVETEAEHIYTLKEGATLPFKPTITEYNSSIKINEDNLLLELVISEETYTFAFTLGNQTVTIPAGAGNAIEYEYGNGYEGELPDVVATAGDGQVTLTWSALGGVLVTSYDIHILSTEGYDRIKGIDAEVLTYTVTGLTNGTEYTFSLYINYNTNGRVNVDVTATPTE